MITQAQNRMMNTEQQRNQPRPVGLANLIETGRATSGVEERYDRARAAFIAAAQELDRQRQRYLARAGEVLATGAIVDLRDYPECREPRQPEPVSAGELVWKD